MSGAKIVINQSGKPAGVPGRSRDDIALNVAVQLSNENDDSVTSWRWRIVSQPEYVTPISLSSPTSSSPTFTPDVYGTYVVELIVDDGRLGEVDRVIIGVRDTNGLRYPAPAWEEQNEANWIDPETSVPYVAGRAYWKDLKSYVEGMAGLRLTATSDSVQTLQALGTGAATGNERRFIWTGNLYRCISVDVSSSVWVPVSGKWELRDFNADATGASAADSAISAALTAAASTNYGRVYASAGTYKITSTKTIPPSGNGVEFFGDGPGRSIIDTSSITGTTTCIGFATGICRGRFHGFTIQGNSAALPGSKGGIAIDFKNSLFNDVWDVVTWDHNIACRFHDAGAGYSAHNSIDKFEFNRCQKAIQAITNSNANRVGKGRAYFVFNNANGGIGLDIDNANSLEISQLAIESFDIGVKIRGDTELDISAIWLESGSNYSEWQITNSTNGLWRIRITNTFLNTAVQDADFNASGHTITQIRDNLLTQLQGLAIAASTTFAASGSDKITALNGQFTSTETSPSGGLVALLKASDRRAYDIIPTHTQTGNALSSTRINIRSSHEGVSQSNHISGGSEQLVSFEAASQVFFGASRHYAAVGQSGYVYNGDFSQYDTGDMPNWAVLGSPAPTLALVTGLTGRGALSITNNAGTANQGVTTTARVPGDTEFVTVNFRYWVPSTGGSDLPFFSVTSGARSANVSDINAKDSAYRDKWRVMSVTCRRDRAGETEPGSISCNVIADASQKNGKIYLDAVWVSPGRVSTPEAAHGNRIVLSEKPRLLVENLGGTANKGPFSFTLDWSGDHPNYTLSNQFTGTNPSSTNLVRPPDGAVGLILAMHIKAAIGGGADGDPVPNAMYGYWDVPFSPTYVEQLKVAVPFRGTYYGQQFIARRVESTKGLSFGTINQSGLEHDFRLALHGWVLAG